MLTATGHWLTRLDAGQLSAAGAFTGRRAPAGSDQAAARHLLRRSICLYPPRVDSTLSLAVHLSDRQAAVRARTCPVSGRNDRRRVKSDRLTHLLSSTPTHRTPQRHRAISAKFLEGDRACRLRMRAPTRAHEYANEPAPSSIYSERDSVKTEQNWTIDDVWCKRLILTSDLVWVRRWTLTHC